MINELEVFYKFHRDEKEQFLLHFNSRNGMHLHTFQLSRFAYISNLPVCPGDSRLRHFILNILMELNIYRFQKNCSKWTKMKEKCLVIIVEFQSNTSQWPNPWHQKVFETLLLLCNNFYMVYMFSFLILILAC